MKQTNQIPGLYDPSFEHDNCGIGACVNIKGVKNHQTVDNALKIVETLEHRAGKDAAGETGDGVGIMLQISHKFFSKACKAANINITQALVFSAILILIMSALCFYFVEPLGRFLGSSDKLLPYVIEYLSWYVPFLVFYEILNISMFYIRLDGSPNYAMMCNATAAILNNLLDYIFIIELD